MELEIEIMKLRCESCNKIIYREDNDGLISTDCLACKGSLTVKPTGDISQAVFEEF